MRRARIVWVIGAKLAIALALSLPVNFRRTSVEYRTLGSLDALEAGALATLAGQRIGKVVAVRPHRDTTPLRVEYARGAEHLLGSRTVRLRRMGLDLSVVLEISLEPSSARRLAVGSFALGEWLTVGPDPPSERPLRSRRSAERTLPPLFHLLPLPAPARPRIATALWRT